MKQARVHSDLLVVLLASLLLSACPGGGSGSSSAADTETDSTGTDATTDAGDDVDEDTGTADVVEDASGDAEDVVEDSVTDAVDDGATDGSGTDGDDVADLVCMDEDGDGHGPGCEDGPDMCDSNDLAWTTQACENCGDDDDDTYYAGCDAYTDVNGPDCDPDSAYAYQSGYWDLDGDGAGDMDGEVCIGEPVLGVLLDNSDCDDSSFGAGPGGWEIPGDGIDQDCVDGDLPVADVADDYVFFDAEADPDGDGTSNSPYDELAEALAAAEACEGAPCGVIAAASETPLPWNGDITDVNLLGGYTEDDGVWTRTSGSYTFVGNYAGDPLTINLDTQDALVLVGIRIDSVAEVDEEDTTLVEAELTSGQSLLIDDWQLDFFTWTDFQVSFMEITGEGDVTILNVTATSNACFDAVGFDITGNSVIIGNSSAQFSGTDLGERAYGALLNCATCIVTSSEIGTQPSGIDGGFTGILIFPQDDANTLLANNRIDAEAAGLSGISMADVDAGAVRVHDNQINLVASFTTANAIRIYGQTIQMHRNSISTSSQTSALGIYLGGAAEFVNNAVDFQSAGPALFVTGPSATLAHNTLYARDWVVWFDNPTTGRYTLINNLLYTGYFGEAFVTSDADDVGQFSLHGNLFLRPLGAEPLFIDWPGDDISTLISINSCNCVDSASENIESTDEDLLSWVLDGELGTGFVLATDGAATDAGIDPGTLDMAPVRFDQYRNVRPVDGDSAYGAEYDIGSHEVSP